MKLQGKKVLVVGMGKSGVAAARFALSQGAHVTLTDQKTKEQLSESLADAAFSNASVTMELGHHSESSFLNADLIVVSPGISPDLPPLAAARARGVEISSELALALEKVTTPIVAVSGTSGKTTASTLLARMIREDGKTCFLGGNIGTPLLDFVMQHKQADFIVLEISSFQLDLLQEFSPAVVAMMPIQSDHLNRYGTVENYAASKRRLVQFCGPDSQLILNSDNSWHRDFAKTAPCDVTWYSATAEPELEGSGKSWRDGDRTFQFASKTKQHEFKLENPFLPPENFLVAATVCEILGIGFDAVRRVAESFSGLPHRLELVRVVDEVSYVNDSKATNVMSVLFALEQFEKGKIIWLGGGRNKDLDLSPLKKTVIAKCREAALFGEARQALKEMLGYALPTHEAKDFGTALELARNCAKPGDTVLLAPACASHDAFASYEQRGDFFREWVRRL